MKIPKIPSWCKGLPDSTILFSCDILEFFKEHGDTSSSSVAHYISQGLIPNPLPVDFSSTPESPLRRKQKNKKSTRKKQWLLGDIRKLRKDMLNEKT